MPPSLENLATSLLIPRADSHSGEVVVFVHHPTRSITLVDGSLNNIHSILQEFPSNGGPLPASRASINSLPLVQVSEPAKECPICLAGYEEAKEMPCKHRFHASCINTWLGIHGSCPLCRFTMPPEEEEEEEEENKLDDGWRIQVVFASMTRADLDSDSDYDTEIDDGD